MHDHGVSDMGFVEALLFSVIRNIKNNNMCGCYALMAAVVTIDRLANKTGQTFEQVVQDGRDMLAEAETVKEAGVN